MDSYEILKDSYGFLYIYPSNTQKRAFEALGSSLKLFERSFKELQMHAGVHLKLLEAL